MENKIDQASDKKNEALYYINKLKILMSDWKKLPNSWRTGEESPEVLKEITKNKFRKNYFQKMGNECFALLEYLPIGGGREVIGENIKKLFSEISGKKIVLEKQIDEMDRIADEIIKKIEENYEK